MATIAEITAMPEAEKRLRESHAYIQRGKDALVDARKLRARSAADLIAEGWTQVRISEALKISQTAVSKIINGKPKPKDRP